MAKKKEVLKTENVEQKKLSEIIFVPVLNWALIFYSPPSGSTLHPFYGVQNTMLYESIEKMQISQANELKTFFIEAKNKIDEVYLEIQKQTIGNSKLQLETKIKFVSFQKAEFQKNFSITKRKNYERFDSVYFDDWCNSEIQKLEIQKEQILKEDEVDKNKAVDSSNSTNFEKMKWNKKTPLLAYLFWSLKKEKLLDSDRLASNLSKLFLDSKYQNISNDTLNTYFNRLETTSTKPNDKKQIDEIIATLKTIAEKLD